MKPGVEAWTTKIRRCDTTTRHDDGIAHTIGCGDLWNGEIVWNGEKKGNGEFAKVLKGELARVLKVELARILHGDIPLNGREIDAL